MLFFDDLPAYIAGQRERLRALETSNLPESAVIVDVLGPPADPNQSSNPGGHSVNEPVEQLRIDFEGIHGDRHRGFARKTTGRDAGLYHNRGTVVSNRRHVMVVSPHECDVLSERLGVRITPGLLGANLVLAREDGVPFCVSDVPHGTYFAVAPPGAEALPPEPYATLIHYVRQRGCTTTGRAIAQTYDDPTLKKRFVQQSVHPRGILCSVEHPTTEPVTLERGLRVFVKYPVGVSF